MDTLLIYLSIFGFLIGQVQSELCVNWNRDDSYFHCDTCCGDLPYEHCCETWVIGAIVGGVIGGILLIGFVVCIICVVVKQKGKTGRVIQPAGGMVQPPVYTTTVAYSTPYGMHGMQQPPPYPPPAAYPPPNNQNLYGHPPPPLPEGLQSQAPASGSLPGNHRVV